MTHSSRSPASYSDVDQVFRHVLRSGKVTLKFDTNQKATTFVGRANAYRNLLRKLETEAGRAEASPFDHLIVRRPLNAEQRPGDIVVIEPRGFTFLAAFDADGNPLELSTATGNPEAPLPADATRQAAEEAAFLADFGVLGLKVDQDAKE